MSKHTAAFAAASGDDFLQPGMELRDWFAGQIAKTKEWNLDDKGKARAGAS